MSQPAITVEGLGKRYRLGRRAERADTLVGAMISAVKAPLTSFRDLRRLRHFDAEDEADILWALRDVSFDVQQGEVVGIVGHNGAGKSTLLKILSRITEPSRGCIDVYGRISSLLEVGTGFHPELSGRENVYLNGTILGMSKAEIDRKFDEIVDFSGIEKFIDTPVKRYSSGMNVRLAFAVAAHLEPEILLIDEVLAVGDADFQKKCLGKMDSVAKGGRTVLFVSHDMTAIAALCPRTILMQRGSVREDGDTADVLRTYLATSDHDQPEVVYETPVNPDEPLQLRAARIVDDAGALRGDFTSQEPIYLEMDVFVRDWRDSYKVGFELENELGVKIFRSFHNDTEAIPVEPGQVHTFRAAIPANLLNSGRFAVTLLATEHRVRWHYVLERQMMFNVRFQVGNAVTMETSRKGFIAPMLNWELGQLV